MTFERSLSSLIQPHKHNPDCVLYTSNRLSEQLRNGFTDSYLLPGPPMPLMKVKSWLTCFRRSVSVISSSGTFKSGKRHFPANFHPVHVSIDRADKVDLTHVRTSGHFRRLGFSLSFGGRVRDGLGGLQQDPQLRDGLAVDRVRQLEIVLRSHIVRQGSWRSGRSS